MKLLKNGESGQALIMTLIVFALGNLIAVPMVNLAATSLKYHQVIEKKGFETSAADSGVQYALCELGNNRGAFGPEALPSGVNDRTVNVTAEDMGGDTYKITSTASGGSGSSTTIESYVYIQHTAIYAGDGLMTLRHNAVINGDIYYAGTLELLDDATINGEITQGDPVDIGIDPEEYKAEAQSGGTYSGDLIINSSPYSLGPLYITGKLQIENGMEVTLGGTVYVEKNILINDDVIITGAGNLLAANQDEVNKSIEFKKRVTVSPDNIPLIMSVSNAKEIKIGDECGITALIYAPNGKVHFHAKGSPESHVYGAIIGKDVRICEDASVTYHPDLDVSALYVLQILTWQAN